MFKKGEKLRQLLMPGKIKTTEEKEKGHCSVILPTRETIFMSINVVNWLLILLKIVKKILSRGVDVW